MTTEGSDSSANGRLFTYDEFARHLKVKANTVRVAVGREKIIKVGDGPTARIPESELLKWEERFNQLNAPFAWLQSILITAGVGVATLSLADTAQTLGISERLLHGWCQEDLLPFFVRSFTDSSEGSRDRRVFVRSYVLRLRHSSNGTRVTTKQAKRYFELCAHNERIM